MSMSSDNGDERPTPVVLMWSGGKDAVLSLERLALSTDYAVQALLTTVVDETDTVTMHGTPRSLVEAQADALGCPLHVMEVPPSASNATYEAALERTLAPLQANGITTVAAGDVHLEDIRAYRESLFDRLGMTPLFPLWQTPTIALAEWVLERGYEAVVTSVDTTQLNGSFAGRAYDADLLDDLPNEVDPCGEDGTFHTFVWDGPQFSHPIPVSVRETCGTGRMQYARLRPA